MYFLFKIVVLGVFTSLISCSPKNLEKPHRATKSDRDKDGSYRVLRQVFEDYARMVRHYRDMLEDSEEEKESLKAQLKASQEQGEMVYHITKKYSKYIEDKIVVQSDLEELKAQLQELSKDLQELEGSDQAQEKLEVLNAGVQNLLDKVVTLEVIKIFVEGNIVECNESDKECLKGSSIEDKNLVKSDLEELKAQLQELSKDLEELESSDQVQERLELFSADVLQNLLDKIVTLEATGTFVEDDKVECSESDEECLKGDGLSNAVVLSIEDKNLVKSYLEELKAQLQELSKDLEELEGSDQAQERLELFSADVLENLLDKVVTLEVTGTFVENDQVECSESDEECLKGDTKNDGFVSELLAE